MKKSNKLLVLVLALVIWGPPSLRLTKRSLSATIQDPTDVDLAILVQIAVWLGAGILVLLMLFRQILLKKPVIPSVIKQIPARWYFIYGLIAIMSTTYSVFPYYTLFFSLKIMIAMMLIGYWIMLHRNSPLAVPKLLQLFYLVFILQGAVIVLLYFLQPAIVGVAIGKIGYRLHGGIFADYGGSMLVTGLFLLNQIFYGERKHRSFYFILYIISWYFLLLSRTRSTITAGLIFLLIYGLLNDDLNKKIKLVWSFSIMTIIVFWIGYFDPIIDYITRQRSGFDTLSGRTIAFSFLFERWKESPWFGYGFAAGVRIHLFDFVKSTSLGIGNAHDSLSKSLIDLGVVGSVPLLLAFWGGVKHLVLLYKNRIRNNQLENALILQILCLMIMVSIQSIVSGGVAALSIPFIIVIYSIPLLKPKGSYLIRQRKLIRDFEVTKNR